MCPESIQELFDNIAERYDSTNCVLSFNLHRIWNERLINSLPQILPENILVDLCSGTGDIALCYLHKAKHTCTITCVDFSSHMLKVAKKKMNEDPICSSHRIHFLQADVQKLPLQNCITDCVTMAYGLRNVHDPFLGIQEAFRILKPGGTFAILELTRPTNRLLKCLHHLYLRYVIPLVGKWFTSNQNAYIHLYRSIQSFLSPQEIEKLFEQVGFSEIQCQSLSGGIATIITGKKL